MIISSSWWNEEFDALLIVTFEASESTVQWNWELEERRNLALYTMVMWELWQQQVQILAMGMQTTKHDHATNKHVAMDPTMMGTEDSNISTEG